MYLVHIRTSLKNRIHATMSKYALSVVGVSDILGKKGCAILDHQVMSLPPQTRFTTLQQLADIDMFDTQIAAFDERLSKLFDETEEIRLLKTMPGIGFVFSILVSLEVGDVGRFGGPGKLASYAGTVPRVHSSGGKTRHGRLHQDVNRYLKWAYLEAANTISANRKHWPDRHVVRLYNRLKHRRGHATAIGALARHLAESTYWILTKKEKYRDPYLHRVSSTVVQARICHEPLEARRMIATYHRNNIMPPRRRRDDSGESGSD